MTNSGNTPKNAWIRSNWLTILLTVLPIIWTIITWSSLPDEIPSHWNIKGEIDGYGPKWVIFAGPLITIFIIILIEILTGIDPRGNVSKFKPTVYKIYTGFAGFNTLLYLGMYLSAQGFMVDVAFLISMGILILFLILGNYMGKLRTNYFIGIRTPWTLENETVWNLTHRLTGKIWVGSSLIMMFVRLMTRNETFFILFIIYVLFIVIIPIVYSYMVYQKVSREQE